MGSMKDRLIKVLEAPVSKVEAGRGGGSIVITSSILGPKGAGAGLSAYAASKHADGGMSAK
jgi:NAD(P)-dependent dehydrogenase (short-subunit alcohol dehydrogenase family)